MPSLCVAVHLSTFANKALITYDLLDAMVQVARVSSLSALPTVPLPLSRSLRVPFAPAMLLKL